MVVASWINSAKRDSGVSVIRPSKSLEFSFIFIPITNYQLPITNLVVLNRLRFAEIQFSRISIDRSDPDRVSRGNDAAIDAVCKISPILSTIDK